MLPHPFHMDGGKRTRWAHIFARAAARAALRIHNRFFGGVIRPNQIDDTRGADLGAGGAGDLIRHRYASTKINYGPADL